MTGRSDVFGFAVLKRLSLRAKRGRARRENARRRARTMVERKIPSVERSPTPDTLLHPSRVRRFSPKARDTGARVRFPRLLHCSLAGHIFGARDRYGHVFDRRQRHCVARVATSGGCLAASCGRHAGGRPRQSSAWGRGCFSATRGSARRACQLGTHETVRRTVRGENECRSPRPRPRAPHPRRMRTLRCLRLRRETCRPKRRRTPEGS